jgi:hypothetical protein
MAYDEELAQRLRALLEPGPELREKRMFGGLAFLINGHLSVSVSGKGGLMVRIDPADTEALLREPHTECFEMRGRELAGWLRIDPAGVTTDRELLRWAERGVTYARTLPPR